MIYLRQATFGDLPLIMAWRNNQLVYKGFVQQTNPLVWEEHLNWWNSLKDDQRVFVICYDDRPVGVVTTNDNEVGYYIGEVTLWGQGIGTQVVGQVCDWLKDKGTEDVYLRIKDDNIASQRLATKLGFKKEGYIWIKKL